MLRARLPARNLPRTSARSLRCFVLFGFVLASAILGCRKRSAEERVFTGGGAAPPSTLPTAAPTSTAPPVVVPPAPTEPFSKAALLRAVADCSVERTRTFESLAKALVSAAVASTADRTDERAATLREAWRAAMSVWQELEVFGFGPAASTTEPGGQGLRDSIYAWPLGNRCKVEEQIVARTYATPGFETSLVSGRGLGAVEYLLFYPGSDNACSNFSTINAQGSWAALSGPELSVRKADYARRAAEDIAARATALASAWDPTKGNFSAQLATAGNGSTTYPADTSALNSISFGLFYIDNQLKDEKVGRPVGLYDCLAATCPQGLESPWAKASGENIRKNLVGFRRLFQGCGENYAGFGFDDWLISAGASDLANRMLQALASAEATVLDLGAPFEDVLASTPDRARAVHVAIKALTDLLKTEFVTVLNLELPKASEGDND